MSESMASVSRNALNVSYPADLTPPSLAGKRCRLRVVRPADYPFLYELALDPSSGFRWRYRSNHPGFEEFVQTFRQGVLLNFIVEDPNSQHQLGYIACYRHDFQNQHAYIAIQGSSSAQWRAVLMQAAHLFLGYLFKCYDFNKIYVECPGFNISDIRSAIDHVFEEEGVLRSHQRFLGRWWDFHILSTRREKWFEWYNAVEERRNRTSIDAKQGGRVRLDDLRFITYLHRELELHTDVELTMASSLREDLNLDSVGFFVLISAVEDLGIELNDAEVASAETISDIYFLYLQGAT